MGLDSAKLRAQINPHTLTTTYYFEYGPSDCSAVPDPCTAVAPASADLGSGHEPVWALSEKLTGLQPGTTYHFRAVAENSLGATVGPDRTFTTQRQTLGFQLADHRAWEMVSPAEKLGAKLVGAAEGLIQASADGGGLVYLSVGSIEPNPEGGRVLEPSAVLARRAEGGAWSARDIATPNRQVSPIALGLEGEYKLFTPDLSEAVLEERTGTPLSREASERTPYLRENAEPPVYRPLVTGKEGFANVPPGTEFGGDTVEKSSLPVKVAAATSDLRHIGLQSEVPLAAGAPENGTTLYEWSDGQLKRVSVLPSGEGGAIVHARIIGSGPGSVRNAISADGSRVFWSPGDYGSEGNHLTALYMREVETEETVRIDVPQPGATGSGVASPVFQGASADGSVVFFTDSQQLTEGASTKGRDLYRCELPLGDTPTGCATLTDLTAPAAGSEESGEAQGLVLGMTDDATTLYFVAKGVFDTAPNEMGESAVTGEPSLYLWREGEGIRYIATLAGADSRSWGLAGSAAAEAPSQSAATSPSGRYLAFMSQRALTGQGSHDAVSGEPAQEVFRYDAVTDQLLCVSCNSTGADPKAIADYGYADLADPRRTWGEGPTVAAILPEPTLYANNGPSLYRPRAVFDSGRVFFNAIDSLVPADSNGQWDVYQYEPTGLGDCTASPESASIVRSGDACVALISSGTGEEEAGFLDASQSGDDVFFMTPAQLSVTDEDHEYDIYDARVDGIPATRTLPTECLGEACQPAVRPPNDPTPASAAFDGHGNVKPGAGRHCPKGRRAIRHKGKVRCVPRRHHHPKRHKAAKTGRASR